MIFGNIAKDDLSFSEKNQKKLVIWENSFFAVCSSLAQV
jgi:hypothetical protein